MKTKKRRPLTRDMLLPLPAPKARALSLQYHLALSVLATDQGGRSQAVIVMRAIYHARLLAVYSETLGAPRDPIVDEMLTVLPLPCATITRISCFMLSMVPSTLVSKTAA